jgi:ABC-type transport system involved in multi-copper enzyme maturation permease subunit
VTAFCRLVRAEWLKLTRRPLTRILLAAFLGMLAVQSTVYALLVVAERAGLIALGGAFGAAQLEEYARRASFPGVVGAVFDHVNGLGGVFTVILAGAAMGSEYDWGTLRTQLCRTPDRVSFLLAKVTALLLVLTAGALVTLVFGLTLGAVLGVLVGGAGRPDPAILALVPLALVRALFVLLPYALLAVCLAVARRSLLAGVAGGLLYLVFEAGLGALAVFAALGEPWRTLYGLTIGQNIGALTLRNSHAFGLRPEVLAAGLHPATTPSILQATIVVAAYSVVFLATAARWIRRDVAGRF